jgi:hypothetical protein
MLGQNIPKSGYFEFHKQIMICSCALQIAIPYILDLMFSIELIHISSKNVHV